MLAIFHKAFAHPPEELNSPETSHNHHQLPRETLRDFLSRHDADNTFSMTFGDAAALACVRHPRSQRLFCGYDDIYCLFLGTLDNLWVLRRQYGLPKMSNEAMFVIEAYRTLRDRGPYPADQVVKGMEGSFGLVVYDSKAGTVFTALNEALVVLAEQGSDGRVEVFWGIAADGSVVISDDLQVIKTGCAKSFAPFPAGCMFHSEGGLMSFEHPMNKVKAMPRVDSQGVMCGANFKVDVCTRVNSIPRRGSESNWMEWDSHA